MSAGRHSPDVPQGEVRFATTDAGITHRYPRLAEFGDAFTDAVRCEIVWAALREVLPRLGVDTLLEGVAGPEQRLLQELLDLRAAHEL